MDYDIEREKQKSEEIRQVFREIFPLVSEFDLPWAAGHIKSFLQRRIAAEIQEGTFHFTSSIVGVLCEVSPPKTHVVDMARICVNAVKTAQNDVQSLLKKVERLESKVLELTAK